MSLQKLLIRNSYTWNLLKPLRIFLCKRLWAQTAKSKWCFVTWTSFSMIMFVLENVNSRRDKLITKNNYEMWKVHAESLLMFMSVDLKKTKR